ncbi:hypothetical protein [Meiothermus granaticius]|nr:hypothetical protein [Meiothermus granaticius]MCL6527561.1 hypothetical protein [Thermaceae bacterium]
MTKLAYSVKEFAQAVGLSRNHAHALVRGFTLDDPLEDRRDLARGMKTP